MASEVNISSSIVENWLRSVNLVQYTQAFLDNGYDDLEVCKQIGEEDLDAIGVPRDQHREKLLRAVKVLREEGGAAVYFTLEECDTCQSDDETEICESNEEDLCHSLSIVVAAARSGGAQSYVGASQRLDAYDMGKTTLVSYPKVQLKLILRDKLVEDGIDLSCPPYTNPDLVVCGSSLTALAMRFAEELKTHFIDVLERLEELWMVARDNDVCPVMCRSPSRSVYSEDQTVHCGYHYQPQQFHYPGSPRSQPPPLPSCPPPTTMSSMNIDKCSGMKTPLEGNHNRSDPLTYQNYAAVDGGVCCIFPRKITKEPTSAADDKKKGGSLFGRFFRNIGFRKSGRKGSYKQHQGDLSAYEISMSEEDRMALMILVKEGRISTQTALAVVQRFEEEKKGAGKTAVSDDGKENVCDTPSKKGTGKKKKGTKPVKSQSTLSADDPQRCQPGHQGGPTVEQDQSCDHQKCRQRRVHSLGQLEIPQFLPRDRRHEKMHTTQTLSTLPTGSPSRKLTSQMEPSPAVRLHSPSHQQLQLHQLQPPTHHHHHHHHHHTIGKTDTLQERLAGRSINTVPKTSSKTSLLSSGSDQSMDCGSQTPLRTDFITRQGGDPTTYNSNSTVSMKSETNSPAAGRKKSVAMLDPRLKGHRSASCSTGDDGISSENDDAENSSRRHLQIEAAKAKVMFDTNRTKVREALISRPPLLRQRSAPVGSPIFSGAYLGQAKVIVDYTPGPDEEDFVRLRKGEIVNIINMAQSGVWRGIVAGKRGKFRFEHVEVVTEPERKTFRGKMFITQKAAPRSVGDLLQKIGLELLTTSFMQNGYDDLDIFSELDEHDLDALHITDAGHRAKLLSAARVLVDWHDKMNAHTPTLTNMDSPSSRAGNSSCDSGCYAGGEGKYHPRSRDGTGGAKEDEKKAENTSGHQHNSPTHTPCRSCGKPKQPRKHCGPPIVTHYAPGQYPTQTQSTPSHIVHNAGLSPYSPGHFHCSDPQQYGQYAHGNYGYHYSPGHSLYGQGHPHHTMPVSKTLTELSVVDKHSPVYPESFMGRRPGSNSTSPVYGDKLSVGSGRAASDKGSVGDRVSLTEEDQEVIAITYGTNQPRKLVTPIQSLSSGSSQMEMTNTLVCNTCAPPSGCVQCDESMLCDSTSCPQCAAYISCPQCFPYRHYVNTTLRSESKSSKMSCSSACTQTTCLSPDHDDSSHSGGQNLIDYTTSPSGGYYLSKTSPSKTHPQYCCQQQCLPHPFHRRTPTIPGTPTPKQTPSPVPISTSSASIHPVTLAFTDTKTSQGLALTLTTDAPSSPAPLTDWGSHSDDNDAPGIATLYSRAMSRTPDKMDASQMKSPTRSLMPLVSTKLSAERIDLTKLPYSTVIGHCGIPPLLVQRYSEELRQDLSTMSLVLEQLREKQLRELGRPCIVNESLSESCKNACDLQISSVQNFLVSIGLPMYQKSLAEGGINTLEQLLKLKESELEQMTDADSRHLRRIAHALEWVQHKLASPSHKARATGVTDKV